MSFGDFIFNHQQFCDKVNNIGCTMNPIIVIIAMINGMIGGLILVLPILAKEGGTILSFIVIFVTGFFSFYSCYLCVIHLGSHSDLDKAIYYHFNKNKIVRIFYDLMVFSNLILILMLYFNLIVQQWEGLVAPNLANPLSNFVALFVLIFILKYVHFGAQLLGYGIISIVLYCIFLIWLVASAPPGDNHIPEFGKGAVNLAASMGQAFAIQTFFIPVLRQLPMSETKNYTKYTFYAYLVGGSVYIYIAYAGAFGILNRKVIVTPLQTIEDYFSRDQWEVAIVEAIYLVHLYSAFGEFSLVCKKRFFSVFSDCGAKQTKEREFFNIPELIFILAVLGITIGVYFAQVSIDTIIEINGAVVGFFFIYFIPAAMHFKCLYFPTKIEAITLRPRQTELVEKKEQKVVNTANNEEIVEKIEQIIQESSDRTSQRKKSSLLDKQSPSQSTEKRQVENQEHVNAEINIMVNQNEGKEQIQICTQCPCKPHKNIYLKTLDILSIIGMVALGLFIMVNGIISVADGTS